MSKKLVYKLAKNGTTFQMQALIKKMHGPATAIYRKKDGKPTQQEAQDWFNAVQAEWAASIAAQKAYSREKKKAKAAREQAVFNMPLQELARHVTREVPVQGRESLERETLRYRLDTAWEGIVFEYVFKAGKSEKEAVALANATVGKNWTQRLAKALNGEIEGALAIVAERSVARAQGLAQIAVRRRHKASESAKSLLTAIKKIPGFKVLTLIVSEDPLVFDVSEGGVVGHDPGHEAELLAFLDQGIADEGSLFIRQQIPNSAEMATAPNGKQMPLYWCALFAAFLHNGTWLALPAEAVEDASTQDQAGNKIPPEERVVYRDFSEFVADTAHVLS